MWEKHKWIQNTHTHTIGEINSIRLPELWSFSTYLHIFVYILFAPENGSKERNGMNSSTYTQFLFFLLFLFATFMFDCQAHTKHNRSNKNRTQTQTKPNKIVSELLKERVHITFVWSLIQTRHLHRIAYFMLCHDTACHGIGVLPQLTVRLKAQPVRKCFLLLLFFLRHFEHKKTCKINVCITLPLTTMNSMLISIDHLQFWQC